MSWYVLYHKTKRTILRTVRLLIFFFLLFTGLGSAYLGAIFLYDIGIDDKSPVAESIKSVRGKVGYPLTEKNIAYMMALEKNKRADLLLWLRQNALYSAILSIIMLYLGRSLFDVMKQSHYLLRISFRNALILIPALLPVVVIYGVMIVMPARYGFHLLYKYQPPGYWAGYVLNSQDLMNYNYALIALQWLAVLPIVAAILYFMPPWFPEPKVERVVYGRRPGEVDRRQGRR